jgi:head-tail adaptor
MRIGKMDRRVVFKSPTNVQSDYGQVGSSYTTTATVWADVVYRGSPREKLLEASIFPESDIAVIIRNPRTSWTLGQRMRLEYNSETYEIHGWQEIGRNEGFRVFASKIRD